MEICKYCSEKDFFYPFDNRKLWIGAAIGALGSIASTLMTNDDNKRLAERNNARQYDYSRWLLANQTQEQVRDARKAGLNPAFMNGSQLGNTPPSPSPDTPTMQAPDFSNLFLLEQQMSNIGLQRAQSADLLQSAEQKRLDNERQKIENARMVSEDKNTAQYLRENAVDFENLEEWSQTHPNELPDAIAIGDLGASGAMTAKERIKRYERSVQDLDINAIRNNLEKLVTSGQITDAKILRALENMPLASYRNILATTKQTLQNTSNLSVQNDILQIDKVTAQLEQDITRDSNINQYIDKMFDGDFEIKDLCKVLVMSVLGSISNFGSVAKGVHDLRR